MNTDNETLLNFPCEFAVKAMGKSCDKFEGIVVEIVSRHVEDITLCTVTTRNSKKNGYLAVTVLIQAQSKAQLDAIYMDLTSTTEIIMAI